MNHWGSHQSIWSEKKRPQKYNSLKGDIDSDVVVVGGGITGVVSAFQLQTRGMNVALVTAGNLAEGCTGKSTGHLTQVLDTSFKDLISSFGMEQVRKVMDGCRFSIDFIEEICRSHNIDCDFARVSGFKFAPMEKDPSKLSGELDLARELGLAAAFTDDKKVEFKNQGLFDPFKFTTKLADKFVSFGGQIFENSRVTKIEDGKPCKVSTQEGSVTSKDIILATHSPVGVYVSLHTRIAPYFSYVMGVKIKNPPVPGLYWDTENPYHYFRPFKEDIWIIGGCDHKTGQIPSTLERYIELENYVHDHFEVEEICFYWGDEVYESVDGLPYIGKIPFTESIYTGTGFAGTGLTFGVQTGMILSDLISGSANPHAEIYDPFRIKPVASASSFIKENINVAKWMIGELFDHHQITELSFLAPNEGKIVDTEVGKLAVYKDKEGNLQALSSSCTHLGGTVHWNTAEKTWDCPCHGGRFLCTGEVLSGPPLSDLEKTSLNAEKSLETNSNFIRSIEVPNFSVVPETI